MTDEQQTGQHAAAPAAPAGSVSSETIKTIATILTIGGFFAAGISQAAAVRTEVTEFRAQYSRDSQELRTQVTALATASNDTRERVRVIEVQRIADEREWRSRGEAIERRVTANESCCQQCLSRLPTSRNR